MFFEIALLCVVTALTSFTVGAEVRADTDGVLAGARVAAHAVHASRAVQALGVIAVVHVWARHKTTTATTTITTNQHHF